MSVVVLRATEKDIEEIVNLHYDGIRTGFIRSLGKEFLFELYKAILNRKSGLLLVAKDQKSSNPIGFVAATTNSSRFYRDFLLSHSALKSGFIIIRRFFLFRTSTPNQVSSSKKNKQHKILSKLFKIYESLKYPINKKLDGLTKAELLSIVVDKGFQGSAVSTNLMGELKSAFNRKQIKSFRVVVSSTNERANAYYRKMGGALVCEIEVHKGHVSFVYRIYTHS